MSMFSTPTAPLSLLDVHKLLAASFGSHSDVDDEPATVSSASPLCLLPTTLVDGAANATMLAALIEQTAAAATAAAAAAANAPPTEKWIAAAVERSRSSSAMPRSPQSPTSAQLDTTTIVNRHVCTYMPTSTSASATSSD